MRRKLRAPSPSKAGLCGKVAWRVTPVGLLRHFGTVVTYAIAL